MCGQRQNDTNELALNLPEVDSHNAMAYGEDVTMQALPWILLLRAPGWRDTNANSSHQLALPAAPALLWLFLSSKHAGTAQRLVCKEELALGMMQESLLYGCS